MSTQPAPERAAIAAMGRMLGPDILAAVQALYEADLPRGSADLPLLAACSQYDPAGSSASSPVCWPTGSSVMERCRRRTSSQVTTTSAWRIISAPDTRLGDALTEFIGGLA